MGRSAEVLSWLKDDMASHAERHVILTEVDFGTEIAEQLRAYLSDRTKQLLNGADLASYELAQGPLMAALDEAKEDFLRDKKRK